MNAIKQQKLLLNIKEAAEAVGMSVATLYRKVERGEIAHRRLGKNIRFEPSELLAAFKPAETRASRAFIFGGE